MCNFRHLVRSCYTGGHPRFNAKIPIVELYDLCEVNPCKNDGTCYQIDGKLTCFCEQNYLGDRCEGMYNVCTL